MSKKLVQEKTQQLSDKSEALVSCKLVTVKHILDLA